MEITEGTPDTIGNTLELSFPLKRLLRERTGNIGNTQGTYTLGMYTTNSGDHRGDTLETY